MKTLESIRTLGKILKNQKKELSLLGAISLANSVLSALVPYIYGKLVDIVTNPSGELKLIFYYLGAWLAVTVVINRGELFVSLRQTILAWRVSGKFLLDTASHLITLPMQFHKDKKIGSVLNKIELATNNITEIIGQVVFGTLPSIVSIVFVLIILFFVEWKVGALILALLTLFVLVTTRRSRKVYENQKRINQGFDHAFGELYDAVLNVQTVKSNANERFSTGRIKQYFRKMFHIYLEQQEMWKFFGSWQTRISSFGFIAVFGLGLFLLRQGSLSVGQFIMVIGYMSMVYRPFWNLTQNLRLLQRGMTSIDRALKIFNQKPEAYENPNAVRMKSAKGHFVFRDVSFAYKKNGEPVLDGISFEAKPGEVVALVGESGVGKSTLASLLSNYYQPTSGEILLDGIKLENISLKDLRKNIAEVHQEVMLFNDTIRNNIRYGKIDATDEEVMGAARAANAHEFIEKFPRKYDQLVGERGIKLSAGQKQRVAIARALLKNPGILILDEATSALDSQSEKLVQEALARLIKDKTTFIIAHRLSTIRHADKIIVLEGGKIIQMGTHDELIKQDGLYKHLCSLQHIFI